MKSIQYEDIVKRIKTSIIHLNCVPDKGLLAMYDQGIAREKNLNAKKVLETLKENALIAKERMIPICQDTGTLVCFLKLGNQVEIIGGSIQQAIYDGVEAGYREGYLRKSMVSDPFERKNTENNLPPVLHTELVEGEILTLILMAKGAGSENMSALAMLTPSQGIEGVKKFVLETVRKAGPNPCPPILVGVGVGGNFEGAALLAKRALIKDLEPSLFHEPQIQELEKELEKELNQLNIGPLGFGGDTSVFGVRILTAPCHIASLPVAVNINCHVVRHRKIEF